jgi:acetate kinase
MHQRSRILVFNCGSSSLKFRVIAYPGEIELIRGEAQRVGPRTAEPSRLIYMLEGTQHQQVVEMADHAAALEVIMRLLAACSGLMPDAIGHRTVHGGQRFDRHTILDDAAIADLQGTCELAPLHMPSILRVIRACRQRYPDLPQVAVFDTAYHSTIPPAAKTYALSPRVRDGLGVAKIGFHGISHQYVVMEAARILNKPVDELRAVSCHLGSGGASLCAVVNGKSIDSTMGYSPLAGLVMSTRSGDIDPNGMLGLLAGYQGDVGKVENLLNRGSGVLGTAGISADIRDVIKAATDVDGVDADRARRAFDIYTWRLRRHLGAFLATISPADAIIFTDTIGELVPEVREAACRDLDVFDLGIDLEANRSAAVLPVDVARLDSRVRILVIATNEELAIARCTWQALYGAACDAGKGGAAC